MGLVIVIPYDHPMLRAVRRSGAPVFGGGVLSAEIGDDHLFSRLTRCGRVEVSLGFFLGATPLSLGGFVYGKAEENGMMTGGYRYGNHALELSEVMGPSPSHSFQ